MDLTSTEFREELRKIVEELIENYKLKDLQKVFLTREEFKEEMDKWRQELNKIWREIQRQREDSTKMWQKHIEDTEKMWQKHIEDTEKMWQKHIEDNNRHFKVIEASLLHIENKTGPDREQLIFDLMKETLQLEGIDRQKIQKIILQDTEGSVYTKDYITDIDIVLENEKIYLIEVKTTADNRDVQDLLNKADIYYQLYGQKPTELILVALRINQTNYQFAIRKNIRIIVGEII